MIENIKCYFEKDKDAYYLNADGEIRCQSVHGKSYFRYNKAKCEAAKSIVPVKDIISYVNEFFSEIGIKNIESPVMNPIDISYSIIKKAFILDEEEDIIWMKLTTDGYLGVVAVSNDINFDIPTSSAEYDEKVWKYNNYTKRKEQDWKHNSSGILVHKLKKEWNTSFVLVFPLSENKKSGKYNRHDIETAIGNYLEAKGVPILDFYSHNY